MKIRFFPKILIILLTCIFVYPLSLTHAATKKQVVILDIPRFDIAEISKKYPHWYEILVNSSPGLISLPSPNGLTPDQVYLYFNQGAMLKIPADGCQIYDVNETIHGLKADELYQSLTGQDTSLSEAVNININEIMKQNENLNVSGNGFLGRVLHERSLKTAAIGNTDTDGPGRAGAAIVLDQNGLIDFGAVGSETLCRDPMVPYGVHSDPDQILKYYRFLRRKRP